MLQGDGRPLKGEAVGCITSVPGITVGHYTDRIGLTGCTVVLCESGAVAGVDVRGGLPGTRDIAVLDPGRQPVRVHAILLSGGSNFGLDAAGGVAKWLEEKSLGHSVGRVVVPIVPGAVIFDLGVGKNNRRPEFGHGYAACAARTASRAEQGSVGVGTGAAVGKLLGMRRAMKGGFGTAAIQLGGGVIVGAAFVTNAIGSVHDPFTGTILAGPIADDRAGAMDSLSLLLDESFQVPQWLRAMNTTLGIIATNASLSPSEAMRLASVAHDGIAMAVRPAHTSYDGDTVFCLSTQCDSGACDVVRLEAAVVAATATAIVNSVRAAESLGGIVALTDLRRTTREDR